MRAITAIIAIAVFIAYKLKLDAQAGAGKARQQMMPERG